VPIMTYPEPGGPKIYGSGSGSMTLVGTMIKCLVDAKRNQNPLAVRKSQVFFPISAYNLSAITSKKGHASEQFAF
jgi:hypothetical protein